MTDGHPGTEGEALGSQRAAIADFGRRMIADGLVDGMSGNLSVRSAEGDLVAITPSGISHDDIGPADICLVRLADGGADPVRTPSTETPMHLASTGQRAPGRWCTRTRLSGSPPATPFHWARAQTMSALSPVPNDPCASSWPPGTAPVRRPSGRWRARAWLPRALPLRWRRGRRPLRPRRRPGLR